MKQTTSFFSFVDNFFQLLPYRNGGMYGKKSGSRGQDWRESIEKLIRRGKDGFRLWKHCSSQLNELFSQKPYQGQNPAQAKIGVEATEFERVQEIKYFIEHLETNTKVLANHVSMATPIIGKIPEDRPKMLKVLEDTLDDFDEDELRHYREQLRQL